MRYTIAAAALAALVSAQSLSDIPSCALPCIDDAIKSSTSCSETDYGCICENEDKLVSGATSCVLQDCGADVATSQVLPAVQKFCAAVESGSTTVASATDTTTSVASTSTATEVSTTSTSAATSSTTVSSVSSSASPTTMSASETTAVVSSGSATSSTSAPTSVATAGAAYMTPLGHVAMFVLGGLAAF
ncbi:hypothetical protein F5Y15DRAFT_427049 [Xylariaceae sp. FL0016]|nr:hypothetical protein F5Y15DRAFT_427049 [Xylariaceae sp. FL0016]